MKTIHSIAALWLVGVALLSCGGCKMFSWSDADAAKERREYDAAAYEGRPPAPFGSLPFLGPWPERDEKSIQK